MEEIEGRRGEGRGRGKGAEERKGRRGGEKENGGRGEEGREGSPSFVLGRKKKSRHLCYSVSRPVFPTDVSCKTDKPIEMPTAHGQLFGALVTSSVVQMYSHTFELNAVKEDVDLVLLLLTSLSGKVLQSIMSVRPSVSSV